MSVGLAAQGCAAPAIEEEEEQGEAASYVEDGDEDVCGVQASQARAKATFDRTTSCAIDAATAGVGAKLKLAGKILGDTKTIAAQVTKLAGKIQVKDVNTARAVMCVRTVGGYAVGAATKDVFTAAAVGLTPAEIDVLYSNVTSQITLGLSSTFKAYYAFEENGSAENLVKFITALTGNFKNVASFVNSCSTVLGPLGATTIPSIAKYSSQLSTLGTIGSIASCTTTVIANAVDVGTELYCLGKDYERIAEQTAAIRRGTDKLCSAFGTYTQNPALRPIVQSGQDKAVCADIVRHWGFCVADAKRDGFFGQKALSCDECKSVCNGYVNGAGKNAYLEPVLAGAYSKTGGAKRQDVQNLVMEAGTCVYGTADDMQPCINTCLGRNANSECSAR
ncbi:MAG: hypothetical protein KIT84_25470 [Labilithrix sp.]|nr:hypothetical protein [Labilithrix sp.]MCW5814402.1 hypothetical protein [Labilithrix sp.]